MNNKTHIVFIGIGGIGMSALARYFGFLNKKIWGYDLTQTELTNQLEEEGMDVCYQDQPEELASWLEGVPTEQLLVVYTPAIPGDNQVLNFVKEKGWELKLRAEVLGMITQHTYSLAVAGTHGKTTISTMLAHIYRHVNASMVAFLGGISVNYQTNLLVNGSCDISILEADEFNRSFLELNPNIGLISAVDPDHLDIYETEEAFHQAFKDFGKQVENTLIVCAPVKETLGIGDKTYGSEDSDYRIVGATIKNGKWEATFGMDGEMMEVEMSYPGRHNLQNALGAAAIAHQQGVELKLIKEALQSFQGVKRRFEYHWQSEENTLIDDYAHHPGELDAVIGSVKEMFEGKKITGIFQPHLYSRTRDFATGFSESLSALDNLLLMDIYPAREKPIEGVSSAMLLEGVNTGGYSQVLSREEILNWVEVNEPEVLLTLGAGDLHLLLEDLKRIMKKKGEPI